MKRKIRMKNLTWLRKSLAGMVIVLFVFSNLTIFPESNLLRAINDINLMEDTVNVNEKLKLSLEKTFDDVIYDSIDYSVIDAGETGGIIEGEYFTATNSGTAVIEAKGKDTVSGELLFEKEMNITVLENEILEDDDDYTKNVTKQAKNLTYELECNPDYFKITSPNESKTITIQNTGTGPLELRQPVHDRLDVGTLSKKHLDPNDTATFTVSAKNISENGDDFILLYSDHHPYGVYIIVEIEFKETFQSIGGIKEIKRIAGCDKTVNALGLPEKINVTTNMRTLSMPVDWDLNGLDYEPSDKSYRELKVKGTVDISKYVTSGQVSKKDVYATVILMKELVDKTGIKVVGKISEEKYLEIKQLKENESNYIDLQSYLGKNQKVLDAFSIRLISKTKASESTEVNTTIPIDSKYEGKLIQVIKKGRNGQISKLTTLVNNGVISVKTDDDTQLLLAESQQISKEVSTASELVDAIKNAGSNPIEIIVKDNIDLTSTVDAQALSVKKDQNITLIDDGKERIITFTRPEGCEPSMAIEEGGILNLTASGEDSLKIKIDGKGSVNFQDHIINKGTLTMDGVDMAIGDLSTYSLHSFGTLEIRNSTIQEGSLTINKDKEQFNNGAIYLEGANSKTNIINSYVFGFTSGVAIGAYQADNITVENSKFAHNGYNIEPMTTVPTEKAGAMRVEETEKLIVKNSSFDNNSSYEGGGIFCRKVNHVEISDSTFSNNKATIRGGGLYFAEKTKAVLNSVHVENCFVMEGNAYDRGGAGIYILDESIVEMNGGHIKDCEITIKTTSPYDGCGGGIYTGRNSRVTIDQNVEIAGNKGNMGGGIYTENNTNKQESIIIKSAWIHKNIAVTDGGGIMILDETPIHMDNAVIRNNSVTRATRGGGGIWLCETGSFVGNSRNGIAVFDNEVMTVSGMGVDATYGKDVKVESPLSNKMKSIWFPETMLGGGDFNWQQDDINKVPADKAYYQNQKTSDKIALATNPSEEAKKEAIAKASIIIEDNEAGFCGGGMGANGKITSGYEQLTVKKVWAGDTNPNQPKEVEIQLYKDGVKEGKPIKLSSDNHWQYTWDKLDGQVKWTADEVSVPKGYSKTMKVEDTLTTFTNTYKKEDLPTQPDLPTDPDKPDEPNQPVNPDQPNLPENPDYPDTPILPVNPDPLDKSTKPDDNESPKTGDDTWIGWFATLVASGVGSALLIRSKKRKRN